MSPTIEAPAEGLVGEFRRPRWGEVWAFVGCEGSVIVHRVLGRTWRNEWLLRGDGAPRTDRAVRRAELVGPVGLLRSNGKVREIRRSRVMAMRLHLRRVKGRMRWWATTTRPGS